MKEVLRNMNRGAPSTEIDNLWGPWRKCKSETDLAVEIPAPAFKLTIVKNRTGV